jgi:hypothetical protein
MINVIVTGRLEGDPVAGMNLAGSPYVSAWITASHRGPSRPRPPPWLSNIIGPPRHGDHRTPLGTMAGLSFYVGAAFPWLSRPLPVLS